MRISNRSATPPAISSEFLGIGVDVTDRKRFEEQLTRSHEQLRALSEPYPFDSGRGAATSCARDSRRARQAMTVLKLGLSWRRSDTAGAPAAERFREMPADRRRDDRSRYDECHASCVRRFSTTSESCAAIELETEQFQQRTGLRCTTTITPATRRSTLRRSVALFRILQEALTNVFATRDHGSVEVSLEASPRPHRLRVEDERRGITADELSNRRLSASSECANARIPLGRRRRDRLQLRSERRFAPGSPHQDCRPKENTHDSSPIVDDALRSSAKD